METDPSPMDIDSNNRMEFGMRMARHCILKEIKSGCNSNLVLSPLSLHAILNLLASGSKGLTLRQLLSFLESQSISDLNAQSSHFMDVATSGQDSIGELENDRGPIISFVNGIWVDHRFSLKPFFKQLAEDVYKARAESVDFVNQAEQVRDEVNSWARKASKGLIHQLLTSGFFRDDTIFALANALYFKGTWLHKFDPSRTSIEDFHLFNGKTVRVPFMKSFNNQHFYGSFEGFKLLKMKYRNGQDSKQYFMYIFLPDKIDGLQELIEKWESDSNFLHENWKLQRGKLDKLWVPKLKFEYELNAAETMIELGLNLPFGKNAELTETVGTSNAFVSKAIHKSGIEVNEEGTVAAAITLLSCEPQSMGPSEPSFVVDHPFMFMIKEEISGIVLFAGAVFNPLP